MQILEEKEAVKLYGKGRKTLNAAEQWLFSEDEENQIRIKKLIGMKENQTADVPIEEFREFGSKAKKGYNVHICLNKIFWLDNLPLKASGRKENILIKKLKDFDPTIYDNADKKEMLPAHAELVREKLNEIIHTPPSWGPED